jgi:hypothetical protein
MRSKGSWLENSACHGIFLGFGQGNERSRLNGALFLCPHAATARLIPM